MSSSSGGSHSSWYSGKKVLVTGGTGTIGTVLVSRLISLGADVTVVSIDPPERVEAVLANPSIHRWGDLRDYDTCYKVAEGMDCVFHLMAVKGNTQLGMSKVASAFVPMLLCNTNMMEAAFRRGVPRYLYAGSIAEYPALDVRHEDDVWEGLPEANDRYVGIMKRVGEVQAETYLQEHGWDAVRIVRLSNVYGPYDDFDPATAQVVPALISRMVGGENPTVVAGDGSAIRDLIYSEDASDGMLTALEHAPACLPINIGSGDGYSIKSVAETIASLVPSTPEIVWDSDRPTGDQKRILATERAVEVLGFRTKTSLRDGIRKTIEWYLENSDLARRRGKELHG